MSGVDMFLTPKEVADLLRVSEYTVMVALKAGHIPSSKLMRAYRVSSEDFYGLYGTLSRMHTLKEVAECMRVHPETVRRWCRDGKVQYVTVTDKARSSIRFTDEQFNKLKTEGVA